MIASLLLLASLWLIGDTVVCSLLKRSNLSLTANNTFTDQNAYLAEFGYSTLCEKVVVRLSFGITMAFLLGAWLLYASGVLVMKLRVALSVHPLMPAVTLIHVVALIIIGAKLLRLVPNLKQNQNILKSLPAKMPWLAFGGFAITFLIFYLFLSYSFYDDGSNVVAGASVFSDFGSHVGMICSLAKGENFPADFPSFTGAGMRYHFVFFLLPAAFHSLGASLPLAINLPSALSLAVVACLLGFIGKKFTTWKAAWLLVPLLAFLRSSLAFFSFWHQKITPLATWHERWQALKSQAQFIGDTPRDDWGLWASNVWANQRHLALGFSVVLIAIVVAWSNMGDLKANQTWLKDTFTRKEGYLVPTSELGKYLMLGAMLVMLPFIHGSMLITALLILAGLAVFNRHRLAYIQIACAAILSAIVQSKIMTNGADLTLKPSFKFGFIVETPSLHNISIYLFKIGGVALLVGLFCALPFKCNKKRRYWLFSIILPTVFAFTVSLTPDVTVNHKYIFVSLALLAIIVVDVLHNLWLSANNMCMTNHTCPSPLKGVCRVGKRILVVVLVFVLTITGVYEVCIYGNINRLKLYEPRQSALQDYLITKTPCNAVFVTAPYHFNEFYFSGRKTYLGHDYYAWSAGYDTYGRHEIVQKFLTEPDPNVMRQMAQEHGFDYLLIDNILRRDNKLHLNENNIRQAFPEYVNLPGERNPVIYKLR